MSRATLLAVLLVACSSGPAGVGGEQAENGRQGQELARREGSLGSKSNPGVAQGSDPLSAAPSADKSHNAGWRVSYAMHGEAFVPVANDGNLAITVPDGLVWLRGELDGERSPLFGIAFPDTPDCWSDPYGYAPSSGVWRMSTNHRGTTDGWPTAERDELNANGWTLQRAKTRDLWVKFERWGVDRYDAASPWFQVRFRGYGHRTDHVGEQP